MTEEKTFQELFPELAKEIEGHGLIVIRADIQMHCLSKQRVRDAIAKHLFIYQGSTKKLLEELGLGK